MDNSVLMLENIGFDQKEAELYLILTKRGSLSVSQIMQYTNIERRTIYDVLERLVQNGRVSFIIENTTRFYSAVPPEVLLENIEQQARDFKEMLPSLSRIQNPGSDTKVEILKGKQGLKTIFQEILQTRSTHYGFGNLSPLIFEDDYSRIVKRFLAEIKKRNMAEKIIYAKGEPITKISRGQYKEVHKNSIPPTPTIIYGDVTVQYIYSRPLTIIKITSKDIAETYKRYFEMFWKN